MAESNKLTKSSQCPCGNKAIKYKGGAYVCKSCDAVEGELSKYLDDIARRHSDRMNQVYETK